MSIAPETTERRVSNLSGSGGAPRVRLRTPRSLEISAGRNHRQAVYFIVAMASGSVKIGIAVDPWARLATLQTGNHEELRLMGYLLPPNPAEVERKLHARFASDHLGGEWFAWSDEIDHYVGSRLCKDWDALRRILKAR